MKARTRLIRLVLVVFLVSIIMYPLFLQMVLNFRASMLGNDPTTIFQYSVRDYLAGYPLFTALFLGAVSPFWMIPFVMIIKDWTKERQNRKTCGRGGFLKSDMKSRELLPRRWIGFLSTALGTLLFYSLSITVTSFGDSTSWILSLVLLWSFLGMTGLGGLLLLDLELGASLKIMAFGLVVLIPWSLIFHLRYPRDFQGLLALFLTGVGILLYHQFYLKHKPDR